MVALDSITGAGAFFEATQTYAIPTILSADFDGRAIIIDRIEVEFMPLAVTAGSGMMAQVKLIGEPWTVSVAEYASQPPKVLSITGKTTCNVRTTAAMKVPIIGGDTATSPTFAVSVLGGTGTVEIFMRIRIFGRLCMDTEFARAVPGTYVVRQCRTPGQGDEAVEKHPTFAPVVTQRSSRVADGGSLAFAHQEQIDWESVVSSGKRHSDDGSVHEDKEKSL